MKNKWIHFGVDKETLCALAMIGISIFIWRKKREAIHGKGLD